MRYFVSCAAKPVARRFAVLFVAGVLGACGGSDQGSGGTQASLAGGPDSAGAPVQSTGPKPASTVAGNSSTATGPTSPGDPGIAPAAPVAETPQGPTPATPVASTAATPATPATPATATPARSPAQLHTIYLGHAELFPSDDAMLQLVPGSELLVLADLTSNDLGAPPPAGRVVVTDTAGTIVASSPLKAPAGPLSASPAAAPSLVDAYSARLPGSAIRRGMKIVVEFDGGVASRTVIPRVGSSNAITLVAVPLQLGDAVGQVLPGLDEEIMLRAPIGKIDFRAHAVYKSMLLSRPPSGAGWTPAVFRSLLAELAQLRATEGASANAYYMGFVPKRESGQIMGVGSMPGNTTVVTDWPEQKGGVIQTLVHELGHNFGLQHVYCTGEEWGVDANYPYPNGLLGAGSRYIYGYRRDQASLVNPHDPGNRDLMSYCAADTFSDYNYRKIQDLLAPRGDSPGAPIAPGGSAPQELLSVVGTISRGKAEMRPLKAFEGVAASPQRGPYRLLIGTAKGELSYEFASTPVDHDAQDSELFVLSIPQPGPIQRLRIVRDSTVLFESPVLLSASAGAPLGASSTPQAELRFTEANGQLMLNWNAARHPLLSVTHVGGTRSMLAQDLAGGTAQLALVGVPSGGSFEFSLSDGINAVLVARPR